MVEKATRNLIAAITKQNLKERRILDIRKSEGLRFDKQINPNLIGEVINDKHEVACTTKRSGFHGTTKIHVHQSKIDVAWSVAS